jgi:hypothetical protein
MPAAAAAAAAATSVGADGAPQWHLQSRPASQLLPPPLPLLLLLSLLPAHSPARKWQPKRQCELPPSTDSSMPQRK